ncbi:MAG TPA: hypothetical protein VGN81_07640 [Pseudonocardiaceae bacterium]|jgi:hypothetical protein
MNTLIEMNTLFFKRPGPDASDDAVAAWYLAKARMHERLAATNGADSAQQQAYAASCAEHARRLAIRSMTGPAAA